MEDVAEDKIKTTRQMMGGVLHLELIPLFGVHQKLNILQHLCGLNAENALI